MNRLRPRLGRFGLDFDRDYGVDHRTGWSAVWDGSVRTQFVSFPQALLALVEAWRSRAG